MINEVIQKCKTDTPIPLLVSKLKDIIKAKLQSIKRKVTVDMDMNVHRETKEHQGRHHKQKENQNQRETS